MESLKLKKLIRQISSREDLRIKMTNITEINAKHGRITVKNLPELKLCLDEVEVTIQSLDKSQRPSNKRKRRYQ